MFDENKKVWSKTLLIKTVESLEVPIMLYTTKIASQEAD
jgi:hypothetical protein